MNQDEEIFGQILNEINIKLDPENPPSPDIGNKNIVNVVHPDILSHKALDEFLTIMINGIKSFCPAEDESCSLIYSRKFINDLINQKIKDEKKRKSEAKIQNSKTKSRKTKE